MRPGALPGLLGRPVRTDGLELRAGNPVAVSVLARELLGADEHTENAALIDRQKQAAVPAAGVNTWTPGLAEWHVPVGEQCADGVSVCGRKAAGGMELGVARARRGAPGQRTPRRRPPVAAPDPRQARRVRGPLRGTAAILHDAVCRDLGFAPDPLRDVRFEHRLAAGDLGSGYEPRVVEVMDQARRCPGRLAAGNRAETLAARSHAGTYCTWENTDAPMRERVVLFGDSFACGEPSCQGLAWLMAQCFAAVHFAWVPFGWDSAVVAGFGGDLVVCELAQRFLVRVPQADLSLAATIGSATGFDERNIDPASAFAPERGGDEA